MKPVQRFQTAPHEGPYEDWGGHSQLVIDGALTSHQVPGYNLLHQFEVGDGYLLVLDYDCPFEEVTVVARLDRAFRVIAKESFGFIYTSRNLSEAAVRGPWTLDLWFGGGPDDWYRLELIEGRHEMKQRQIYMAEDG